MTAVIGLISGFLIADGSMYDTYNKSFEKYNIEDGNFELYSKADESVIDKLEKKMLLYMRISIKKRLL